MRNIKKSIISILTAATLLLGMLTPGIVKAAEEEGMPTATPTLSLTCSRETVSRNGGFYLYLTVSEVEKLAGMSCTIYYDADRFSIQNAYGGDLSDCTVDVNYNKAGEIHFSLLSVDGLNGSYNLGQYYFYVKEDAATGTAGFTLTVNEAYDTDFQTIVLKKSGVNLTVEQQSTVSKSIYMYSNSTYQASKGETVEYSLYSYDFEEFTGGNFVIRYDAEMLGLQNVQLSTELTGKNAVYSINKDRPGEIKISYAGIEKYGNSYCTPVTATFEVLENTDAYTNIQFKGESFLDEELNPITVNNVSNNIHIFSKEEQVALPKLKLVSVETEDEENYVIDVVLEGSSGVAAGDFEIRYDTDYLNVTDVQTDASVTSNGGMIHTNPKYDGGTVKFSFLNANGITEDQKLLRITFGANSDYYTTTSVYGAGSGVVRYDENEKEVAVQLEYESVTFDLTPNYTYIAGTNLSVVDDGTLGLNFYVESSKVLSSGYQVTVTERYEGTKVRDFTYSVADCYVGTTETGYHKYRFKAPVNSGEMSLQLICEVVNPKGNMVAEYSTSVSEYIDSIVNSGCYDDLTTTLAKAVANYGAAAQKYFNTYTATYANEGLYSYDQTVEAVSAGTLSQYAKTQSGKVTGLTMLGSSLLLEDGATIRLYFRLQSGYAISQYTVNCNGQALKWENKSGTYYVDIDAITASRMEETNTITVKRGNETYTCKYNVLSYAYDAKTKLSGNSKLMNLINALYQYEKAARQYASVVY